MAKALTFCTLIWKKHSFCIAHNNNNNNKKNNNNNKKKNKNKNKNNDDNDDDEQRKRRKNWSTPFNIRPLEYFFKGYMPPTNSI